MRLMALLYVGAIALAIVIVRLVVNRRRKANADLKRHLNSTYNGGQ